MFFTFPWMWGDLRTNQKQQPGVETRAQGETKSRTKDVTSEISAQLKDGKLARRRTTTCSETDSSIHLASKQRFPFQGLIANCKDKSGKNTFLAQVHSHPLAVCFVETLPIYLSIMGFARQVD